jgi:hypothetical protein
MTAFKHGQARAGKETRTYICWKNMKHRCLNPKNKDYSSYGGRGISVSPEWFSDYNAFFKDMGECPPGLTLDRIDPNGDYTAQNCRWVSILTQARNHRDSRMLTFNGETLKVVEWAEKIGMRYDTLHGRLEKGWPPERALTQPLQIQKGKWGYINHSPTLSYGPTRPAVIKASN